MLGLDDVQVKFTLTKFKFHSMQIYIYIQKRGRKGKSWGPRILAAQVFHVTYFVTIYDSI